MKIFHIVSLTDLLFQVFLNYTHLYKEANIKANRHSIHPAQRARVTQVTQSYSSGENVKLSLVPAAEI